MKAKIIQSAFYDDKLTPETPRYYLNSIITNIVLFFIIIYIPVAYFIYNGSYSAFPKLLWYLFTDNIKAIEDLSQLIYGKRETKTIITSFYVSLIFPLSVSLLITKLITKPITRRIYKSGRIVNDEFSVIDNYIRNFEGKSKIPENDGLSLVKKNDLSAKEHKAFGLNLLYSNADQEKGLIIAGDAGSGKGVVINHFYKDIAESKSSIAVVHNIKGDELDFISKFSSVYNIAATSLNNETIHAVDFLSLIKNDDVQIENQNIYTFIDAFIEKPKNGSGDYFYLGSREVAFSVIKQSIKINKIPEEFLSITVKLFSKESDKQLQDLSEYLIEHNPTATAYINKDNPKATISVIASSIKFFKKLETLSNFWKKAKHINIIDDFFLRKTRKFLILTNNPTQADVCNSYISATINLASKFLISPNYTNQLNRRIYFIIDEFPQLTSIDIETFLKIPDVGRSKGLRSIVALQRFSQIKENFNADPLNFYSAFHNKIIGRITEADFEIIKGTIGKTSVEDSIVKKTMQETGKFTSTFEKKVHEVEAMKPNELSLKCGPQVINGRFLGVQMYYFIQGYNEIFTFIRTPVDVSSLQEKFKRAKAKASLKKKVRLNPPEASTTLQTQAFEATPADQEKNAQNDVLEAGEASANKPTIQIKEIEQ